MSPDQKKMNLEPKSPLLRRRILMALAGMALAGKVIPFKVIRIISDLICVLIGFLLGVVPGIGTVVTALFMGPLITFFRRTISAPLLRSGEKAVSAAE